MRALPLGAKQERSRLLRRKSVVFAFAKDYFSAAHSPLPKKPNVFGKLGALSEKRRFRTRGLIIYIIHEKSFELTKLFSVILRETPSPLLCAR